MLDGFQFPNDEVSVIQISRIVDSGKFPDDGFYDLAYAINACRQPHLRQLDRYLLIAVSAIFIYCNRIDPLGAPHECEFFRNIISSSIEIGDHEIFLYCEEFIRQSSVDLNKTSSYQECFSAAALDCYLAILGKKYGEGDAVIIELARSRLRKAGIYDLTIDPEEMRWWVDFCDKIPINSFRKKELLMFFPKNFSD